MPLLAINRSPSQKWEGILFSCSLNPGQPIIGTSKAWLGRFGEVGHPVDTSLFATKEYCEQIIGASTSGYSYNYNAAWEQYTRNFTIITSKSPQDSYILYTLPYTELLEFDPTKVTISANISTTITVDECTNPPSPKTATASVTFSGDECYTNGSELSKQTTIFSWLSVGIGFIMDIDKLYLRCNIISAGMLASNNSNFKYTVTSGSAEITVKFLR